MKIFLLLATLIIFNTAHAASGESGGLRHFHLYAGGGFQRSFLQLKGQGKSSDFQSWALPAEVGMDIPLANDFGLLVSGSYVALSGLNSETSDNKIEKIEMKSKVLKVGFFYKSFGIGYGFSSDAATLNQVSDTTGATSNKYSGHAKLGFVNYIFDVNSRVRFTIEGRYKTGEIGGYDLTDINGGLNLFILF